MIKKISIERKKEWLYYYQTSEQRKLQEGHYIIMKGSIHQEDIAILSMQQNRASRYRKPP